MIRSKRELERSALAMTARRSGCLVRHQLSVFKIPKRAGAFTASAPAAHAGHFVECSPAWEGIVRRVHADQPASAGDVFLERRFQFRGPSIIGGVIVENDRLIFAKVRFEVGGIGSGRWRSD